MKTLKNQIIENSLCRWLDENRDEFNKDTIWCEEDIQNISESYLKHCQNITESDHAEEYIPYQHGNKKLVDWFVLNEIIDKHIFGEMRYVFRKGLAWDKYAEIEEAKSKQRKDYETLTISCGKIIKEIKNLPVAGDPRIFVENYQKQVFKIVGFELRKTDVYLKIEPLTNEDLK